MKYIALVTVLHLGLIFGVDSINADIINGSLESNRELTKDLQSDLDGKDIQNERTNGEKSIYCPLETDIEPCICFENENTELEFVCEDASISDYQFEMIFSANFPVSKFAKLTLQNVSEISTIGNILGDLNFESLNFTNTTLNTISDYAFTASYDTLQEIYISHTLLQTESFPFLTLYMYKALTTLTIESSQLTWLPEFQSPSLTKLILRDNYIDDLNPGVLSGLTKLETFDMSQCSLRTIRSGFFTFSPYMNMNFSLSGNRISVVLPGAFSGADPYYNDVWFDFDSNQLTGIREDTFGEVFPSVVEFSVRDNPLDCLCDMAWIITNAEYKNKISVNSTCVDGTDIRDLDPNFYILNC